MQKVDITQGFGTTGVEYVRFATTHPGHFEAMFRPDVLNPDDPELRSARTAAGRVLSSAAARQAGARTRSSADQGR